MQAISTNTTRSIATTAYIASNALRDWFDNFSQGLNRLGFNNNNNDGGPSNVAQFSHDYLTADRLASWLRDHTKFFSYLRDKANMFHLQKLMWLTAGANQIPSTIRNMHDVRIGNKTNSTAT